MSKYRYGMDGCSCGTDGVFTMSHQEDPGHGGINLIIWVTNYI